MVTVNKPSVSTATTSRNASATIASLPSSSSVTQASFDALKRKFQRVNQEIVKQNVMLQEHLARNRQEHHQILQENVRLKGRIVALEGKVREAEGVCHETKKSIGDRIEILEAIGEHLIEVTKFLRVLSLDEEASEDPKNENLNDPESNSSDEQPPKRLLRKHRSGSSSMQSITEEEDCDVFDLTDHIGDVSLQDQKNSEIQPKLDEKTNNRKQPRRK